MADPAITSCTPTTKIGAVTAPGVNSVAVSSPVAINIPRAPINDTGRQMALGTIIGTLVDTLLGGDEAGAAKDAELEWKSMLDNTMKAKGQLEIDLATTQRGKLAEYELFLKDQLAVYRTKANAYYDKLPPLEVVWESKTNEYLSKADAEFAKAETTCVDDALRAVCKYVACGYIPDYNGIASRARADAELDNLKLLQESCRYGNRYNVRVGANRHLQVRLQTRAAAMLATSKAREEERQFMWKTNQELRFKLLDTMETLRVNRKELSIKYNELGMNALQTRWVNFAKTRQEFDTSAVGIGGDRWSAYSESAFKSFREGGEMLAAAAQGYQFLAASIRATAKQSGGGAGLGALIPALVTVLTVFNGSSDPIGIPGISFQSIPTQCT
jgi:hypothetical protein